MDAPSTLADICRAFVVAKRLLVASGELSPRTMLDYESACARLQAAFGPTMPAAELGPTEFAAFRADLASRWGPVRLGVEVTRIRALFRWAADNELCASPKFGQAWRIPTRKAMRLDRKARGSKMFESSEILALLDAARQPLRTMILLGTNGGIGNADLARMPVGVIDFQGGWLEYPRFKTGADRRVPCWDETMDGLRELVKPDADPESLVFVGRKGHTYDSESRSPIGEAFTRLCHKVGVRGRGFYSLRRTFQTIASETRDEVATSMIMGHVAKADDMAAVYRQKVDDVRLRDVADHVRRWLYASKEEQPGILRMTARS